MCPALPPPLLSPVCSPSPAVHTSAVTACSPSDGGYTYSACDLSCSPSPNAAADTLSVTCLLPSGGGLPPPLLSPVCSPPFTAATPPLL
uniref:Uncharacterized protein n=1 Tax=Knipowitschia caucasica TaxID=637954 RepID=A0AAV2K1N0_KNICA